MKTIILFAIYMFSAVTSHKLLITPMAQVPDLQLVPPVPVSPFDYLLTQNADNFANVEAAVRMRTIIQCFLDRSSCNQVLDNYRAVIGEELVRRCPGCTPIQRLLANTILAGLRQNQANPQSLIGQSE